MLLSDLKIKIIEITQQKGLKYAFNCFIHNITLTHCRLMMQKGLSLKLHVQAVSQRPHQLLTSVEVCFCRIELVRLSIREQKRKNALSNFFFLTLCQEMHNR